MAAIRERSIELLSSRRAPEVAAVAALLVALPSLRVGEALDDHILRAAAREGAPAWDRFSFMAAGELPSLRESGQLGWWASEAFMGRFARPLSSLSHALDHALWPDLVWLMHLENAVIYALATWLVARLILRVHGPGLAVGVAGLVFAVDESHAFTVAWIAGRNTLLALVFGTLAVLAQLRWRSPTDDEPSSRRWVYALASPACLALALLSAEAGLCAFGYLVAWAVFGERGAWARRLAPLVPHALIIVAWRIAHVALGFGVRGSSLYLDVDARPLVFVGRALSYPPAVATARLSLPLTDLLLIAPLSWIPLGLAFAALVWALAPVLRRREAKFWLLGTLLAAVPLAATIPTSRLLVILGAGGPALVGLVFVHRRELGFSGFGRRALVGLVLIANLILAPLGFVPFSLLGASLEPPARALAAELPADEPCVILNLPGEIDGLYPQDIRENAGGRWPAQVYLLYAGIDALAVERVDDRTLELHAAAGWAARRIDRFARDWREGFSVGDRVTLDHAVVEVVEVTEDGRPRRVRVRFDRSIDALAIYAFDPSLARWRPEIGELATFTAAVGQG